jgi:DNA-binding CsgD family transcriptional regulator
LTERQSEVVLLVAAGYSNSEAADELGISTRTVEMHVTAIKAKLGVAKRRMIPRAYMQATGENPYPTLETAAA